MELWQKELIISRILSGSVRLSFLYEDKRHVLLIKRPTTDQLYQGQEIFAETLQDAIFSGVFSDREVEVLSYETGIWDTEKENLLEQHQKNIQDFKVQLYQFAFRATEREKIRQYLIQAKHDVEQLYLQKNVLYGYTASYLANQARVRFTIAMSLRNPDGSPYYKNESDYWQADYQFVDVIYSILLKNRLAEPEYREIARTEPWRGLWDSADKSGSLFGCPASEYNEEQREISLWSNIYSSVFQHPDCPPEEVIKDDDVLDGFLISKQRENKQRQFISQAEESISSEKIRNSQEQFYTVKNAEEAAAIESLNSPAAKAVKKQREAYIKKHKVVHDIHLPDVKKRLMMQANQQLSEGFKKK